jgi:hypothetical protein
LRAFLPLPELLYYYNQVPCAVLYCGFSRSKRREGFIPKRPNQPKRQASCQPCKIQTKTSGNVDDKKIALFILF